MRIAILESIVMPAGHEVEFDRILIDELKKQGHEPIFFVPEKFPFKLNYGINIEYLSGGEVISYAGAGKFKKIFLSILREKRRKAWFESAAKKIEGSSVDAIIIPTATYRYLRTLLKTDLKKSPIPIYFIFHGINPKEQPKFEKFAKLCLKYSNIKLRVITLRNDFGKSEFGNVKEVLPPVFKPQSYQYEPNLYKKKPIKIGFFGQFRKEKNLEFLLKNFINIDFKEEVELVVQGSTSKPEDAKIFDDIIKQYSSYKDIKFLHTNLIGVEWEKAILDVDVILLPYGSERYLYHWSAMLFTAIGFYKPVLLAKEINPEVMNKYKIGFFIDIRDELKLKNQIEEFINNYWENDKNYILELHKANINHSQEFLIKSILS